MGGQMVEQSRASINRDGLSGLPGPGFKSGQRTEYFVLIEGELKKICVACWIDGGKIC